MIYYPFTNYYPLEVSHHGTRLSLKVHDLQTMAAEVGEKSIWEGLGGGCWDGHMGLPKKKKVFRWCIYEDFDFCLFFCLHEMDICMVGLFIFPNIAMS